MLLWAPWWPAATRLKGPDVVRDVVREPFPTGVAHLALLVFVLVSAGFVEPPIGIEPMTYSLRVNRSGRLS